MKKLSEHFFREEFECPCHCGFNTVDTELLEILETVRKHFNAAVTINSGCRCKSHNAHVGGSANSQHRRGRAADITVDGVSATLVQSYLQGRYREEYGIGCYANFTHVDSRDEKARWHG